jgi:hypothetical protein
LFFFFFLCLVRPVAYGSVAKTADVVVAGAEGALAATSMAAAAAEAVAVAEAETAAAAAIAMAMVEGETRGRGDRREGKIGGM